MGSEEPKPDATLEESGSTQEPPPPPPEEPTEENSKTGGQDVWREDYEELIEPDRPTKRPRAKKIPWGGIVVTLILIVVLVAWTVLSPNILPQEADTYTGSPTHASWGTYTGYRSIWAGNMTWGVSVSGHATSAGNRSIEITVLVTKVYEKPGNWFFKGTAISLRNVSVYIGPLDTATYLASIDNKTEHEYGVSATGPVSFVNPGEYSLLVKVRFLVYEVMRIGFIPLESVNIFPVYIDSSVVVT